MANMPCYNTAVKATDAGGCAYTRYINLTEATQKMNKDHISVQYVTVCAKPFPSMSLKCYQALYVQLYLVNDCNDRQRLNRPCIFHDRSSPLDSLHDVDLIIRYRLPRQCITKLCHRLNHDVERATQRTQAMSVPTQPPSKK